ncbi:MAG: NAD(P)/FAD-dependent oxidoreductase [Bacteroidota bacterium]
MKGDPAKNPQFHTAIIGAGFAGLGAGIKLKQSTNYSFIIFERASDVGGTWRDNIYPGCGCDVPSHLYSFSFERNPAWSRSFSKQPEILNYIRQCTTKYGLDKHIQYDTEIKHLFFDENQGFWILTDQRGNTVTAKTVIAALGPLNVPVFSKINGRENFGGVSFHSSEWNTNFDLAGKRVAIVGTGASAIQIVPAIADKVAQLTVFQRTPPWIMPKKDKEFGSFTKTVFKKIPTLNWLFREMIYWFMEARGKGFFGNDTILKLATWVAKMHINKSIADPVLREKVTPGYQIGCKRVLPSNDYYPALQKPNVELVTEPIDQVTGSGITGKDGTQWEFDAIVYATGFISAEYKGRGMDVIGRNGRNLFEEWNGTGPEAYYGIAASGYPGLMFILGPNSGLGHNSVIHIMESQINYIMDYLKHLPEGQFLDLKASVQDNYNRDLQQKLKNTVWSSGCSSWYQTAEGKNTTLWYGPTYTFRKLTRQIKLENYEAVKVRTGQKQMA